MIICLYAYLGLFFLHVNEVEVVGHMLYYFGPIVDPFCKH